MIRFPHRLAGEQLVASSFEILLHLVADLTAKDTNFIVAGKATLPTRTHTHTHTPLSSRKVEAELSRAVFGHFD